MAGQWYVLSKPKGLALYPVPNCSILVMFSCNRLFTHASSSLLGLRLVSILFNMENRLPGFAHVAIDGVHLVRENDAGLRSSRKQ